MEHSMIVFCSCFILILILSDTWPGTGSRPTLPCGCTLRLGWSPWSKESQSHPGRKNWSSQTPSQPAQLFTCHLLYGVTVSLATDYVVSKMSNEPWNFSSWLEDQMSQLQNGSIGSGLGFISIPNFLHEQPKQAGPNESKVRFSAWNI